MSSSPRTSEKLVRDKIPENMRAAMLNPNYRIASREEIPNLLEKKLCEEVAEYQASPSLEELADIVEVVESLAIAKFRLEELRKIQLQKRLDNGGFTRGIVLSI